VHSTELGGVDKRIRRKTVPGPSFGRRVRKG